MLGLIGHNGSGKTTLLKLLARQIRPTSGTVHLDGRPMSAFGNRDFARQVAYLPQALPPASGMTVRDLVAIGRYAWHGAVGRKTDTDRAQVDEAMRSTDVTRFADRMVDSLSGGERQRVWLAMTLAQNPRILLLDEPTSALDLGYQLEILSLVRDLATEHGLAVASVLHDINMAARFATDLLALRGGRMIKYGTPQDILAPDILQEIYGVPMAIVDHPTGQGRVGIPQ